VFARILSRLQRLPGLTRGGWNLPAGQTPFWRLLGWRLGGLACGVVRIRGGRLPPAFSAARTMLDADQKGALRS
jgi:hypothetical protein